MGKLPMDLLNPIPEVLEQENHMKEALTKPDSSNFDKAKASSNVLPTPAGDTEILPPESVAEVPATADARRPQDGASKPKKKPRGVSAMSPEKKAEHMKKMREASARSRKAKADAKKQTSTPPPAVVHTPAPVVHTPAPVVHTPAPTPAVVHTPTPVAVHTPQYAPIDYEKLAEVMEKRKGKKTREISADQLNLFEQTIRSQERDRTLDAIEKEQEKKIQEFMNKRTKRKTMPKAGESMKRFDGWGKNGLIE